MQYLTIKFRPKKTYHIHQNVFEQHILKIAKNLRSELKIIDKINTLITNQGYDIEFIISVKVALTNSVSATINKFAKLINQKIIWLTKTRANNIQIRYLGRFKNGIN